MKSKIFFLLSAILIFAKMSAQNNIAIYVIGDDETPKSYNKVVGTALTQAVNADGHFVAVERSNEFLSAIGSEVSYQHSGAVNQAKIVELGKQYGANYVFVVDLSSVLGELYASSRIINVERNIVEAVSDESTTISNLDNLKILSRKIATNTLAKLPYNVAKKATEDNAKFLSRYTEHTIWGGAELYKAYHNYNNMSKDTAIKIINARKALGKSIRYPVIYAIEFYDSQKTKTHQYIRVKYKAINSSGTSFEQTYPITIDLKYGDASGANINGSMFTSN